MAVAAMAASSNTATLPIANVRRPPMAQPHPPPPPPLPPPPPPLPPLSKSMTTGGGFVTTGAGAAFVFEGAGAAAAGAGSRGGTSSSQPATRLNKATISSDRQKVPGIWSLIFVKRRTIEGKQGIARINAKKDATDRGFRQRIVARCADAVRKIS
jgi:hypothetical protein